jgi:histone acetyltransferase (RNA polymerase elongator complex component)
MASSVTKPFIIPVFLPNAGCPHQCAFCNQKTITGIKPTLPTSEDIHRIVNEFLSYKGKDRGETIIAFYGGNFLGLSPDKMETLLSVASKYISAGQVKGIRMSTRPDTVTAQALEVIKTYPVSTVELGVQSMSDPVLEASRRGHSASDTIEAVHRLKREGYEIGLQMMVGLPEDTEERAMGTTRAIVALAPDFVRIYPTVVLKNSPLARWYEQGSYEPMTLDRCVTLVKEICLLFEKDEIPVVRMGLQETEELVKDSGIMAGPYHPSFGHLVYSEIFLDIAVELLESKETLGEKMSLKVRPENISIMRGLNNKNVEILKKRFSIESLDIVPDVSVVGERLVAV